MLRASFHPALFFAWIGFILFHISGTTTSADDPTAPKTAEVLQARLRFNVLLNKTHQTLPAGNPFQLLQNNTGLHSSLKKLLDILRKGESANNLPGNNSVSGNTLAKLLSLGRLANSSGNSSALATLIERAARDSYGGGYGGGGGSYGGGWGGGGGYGGGGYGGWGGGGSDLGLLLLLGDRGRDDHHYPVFYGNNQQNSDSKSGLDIKELFPLLLLGLALIAQMPTQG